MDGLFRLYDTQERKEIGWRSEFVQTIRKRWTQMQDPARYEIQYLRVDFYGNEYWYTWE